MKKLGQTGFTIIELTIATAIFSIVLLVIAIGILTFSRSYLKGSHQSQTQEVARQAIDELSQAIQFSSTINVNATDHTFCTDNTEYTWRNDVLVDGTSSNHALIRSPVTDASCGPATYSNGDTELLSNNMRLKDLQVVQNTDNSVTVKISVIYGPTDVITYSAGMPTGCIGGSGSEFCAISSLETTVQRRE